MAAISVNHISKMYRLYDNPIGRLKESLWRGKRKYHTEFWAVRDVSFEVGAGTTFGIIGRNGSGKSTLLQLIAGILRPTHGELLVNGRISALLELGSGFEPEFTGRENVFMNGSILGIDKRDIEKRFAEIEAFADIGKFIDQPVKLYSSGMYVRLAFATAINVDPDILLVDEALAVGDVVFQHRCMRKIRELQEKGKTIVFVSHDTGAVQKLCSNAILLDNGAVVSVGETERVLQDYYKIVWNAEEEPIVGQRNPLDASASVDMSVYETIEKWDHRFGNQKGEIVYVALTDENGKRIDVVRANDTVCFSMIIRINDAIDMPIAGLVFRDLLGNELINTNTDAEGVYLPPCAAGTDLELSFALKIPDLKSGSYSFSAGFGNGTIDSHCAYDWIENIKVIQLENHDRFFGLLNTAISIKSQLMQKP